MQNDDSEILSVVLIAFFGSEAVRVTGSLLLSFAGGDTACPAGMSHSDAAWAALQHGISAAFALATWQFNFQLKVSMKECLSGQLNLAITGFILHTFMTTHAFQLHFADTEQYFLRPPGLLSVTFMIRHHFQLHVSLPLVLFHLTMAKLYPQTLNQRLSRVRSAEDVFALVDRLSEAFNCIHLGTAFLSPSGTPEVSILTFKGKPAFDVLLTRMAVSRPTSKCGLRHCLYLFSSR